MSLPPGHLSAALDSQVPVQAPGVSSNSSGDTLPGGSGSQNLSDMVVPEIDTEEEGGGLMAWGSHFTNKKPNRRRMSSTGAGGVPGGGSLEGQTVYANPLSAQHTQSMSDMSQVVIQVYTFFIDLTPSPFRFKLWQLYIKTKLLFAFFSSKAAHAKVVAVHSVSIYIGDFFCVIARHLL